LNLIFKSIEQDKRIRVKSGRYKNIVTSHELIACFYQSETGAEKKEKISVFTFFEMVYIPRIKYFKLKKIFYKFYQNEILETYQFKNIGQNQSK